MDWNHQEQNWAFVFQVSVFGFDLILNQTEVWTAGRAGHGRVFIGLDDDQSAALIAHIRERSIQAKRFHWGRPTLVIQDLDGNEIFFWLTETEWARLEPELANLRG